MNGAKVVARAWCDPEYRKRLLEDGTEDLSEEELVPLVIRDFMIDL